jgi:hypothetical protein
MRSLAETMRTGLLAGAAALLGAAGPAAAQGPPPAMVRLDAARRNR